MMDTKNIFINTSASLKETLKQLDTSALGVLLVVDDLNKLLGTITDGDVRRTILSGAELSESINGHYNSHPYFFLDTEYSDEKAKEVFLTKRFELIPVVDQNRTVLSFVTWDSIFSGSERLVKPKQQIDIPLVIMAGGKGTRMAPFTNVLPKPLIPIGEKTILELILDEFKAYGIKKSYFTLNYRGEMIRAYFDGMEHPYSIEYLWEKEFYGTAGSLKLLGDKTPEAFFVSNCDIIVKANFADIFDFHKKNNSYLTVVSSIQHTKIPYGVIHFMNGGKIESIEEKPEFSFTINTGVYVLNKKCLDYIPGGRVFHMTDLIQALMDDGKDVYTYPINENEYIDVGQWEEYRNAVDRMKVSNDR
jgi:Nucleoside-diphosphate-sugar pyrophosphorylase involved in lipopolysaccharide biosynthesis/translation initiation factor 2B, gamma/epsilon subunits (eIF-2Bgamma/eIF-2Bepsilon)